MHLVNELNERLRRLVGQGWPKNARVRRWLLGGLFFALLTLILSGEVGPQRLDIRVKEVAPRDLAAPQDMVNRLATERKKDAAARAIPVQTKVDPEVLRQGEDFVTYAFAEVNNVRTLPNQDLKTKVATMTGRLNLGSAVPSETIAALLSAEESLLAVARQDSLRLVKHALSRNVAKEDVADLRAKIDQEIEGFTVTTREPWLKSFIRELVKSRIRSNLVEDPEATKRLQTTARATEEPVIWKKGQLILKKGEPVTDEQYVMLTDLRLVGPGADFRSLVGTALLAAIMVFLVGLYLARHRPDIYERDSKLLMLGLIFIVTLMLSLLMHSFQDPLGPGVGYLMPVAFNSILVTILLDPKVALLQSVLLSVLAGFLMATDPLNLALVLLVGSTVGVFAVARVENRTDIYRAGLLVSAANAVAILAVYLIKAYSLLDLSLWVDVGLGAANGLITAVLVTGALPFFESVFRIVTPLKLLELSNPNHPLLKRLLVEAPGSYHHTILVANLGEAAAEAIGADQVLARVGAYYHDIGKTKRPYFFVENQMGGENPHDKLPPSLSALIITSHVKDGLEMAREARLPQEIIDFIPEHHGTSLVSYFYHMASKNGGSEYVLEEDFRYDGPKPRSKETAICMLADGCEASVRALRQKGPLSVEQIEQQVRRIVDDRLKQGQLENSDLTLREIETISRTFVKVLSGVHHARVEYPADPGMPATKLPADATEEATPHGDLGQQRSGETPGDRGPGGNGPTGG